MALFDCEKKDVNLDMHYAKPIQKEHRHIVVHFDCEKDMNDFSELIGVEITKSTKELYYDISCSTKTAVLVESKKCAKEKEQPKQSWEYWWGMPEYISYDKQGYHMVYVYFKDDASKDAFIKLVNQQITPTTKYIWYPEKEKLSRLASTWVVEK